MHETTTLTPGTPAFLIARVSDPGQRDALPAQELRLNKYAEHYQLKSKLYSFDESAFKEHRNQFEDIVQEISNYPEKCIAVFDKVDRLTRDSSSEVVRILKWATKNGKIELHFPSENLVLRKGAPAVDWTRFTMGAAFAEYYSGAISDNVKRRIEQKLHDGEWPGKAPIGYINHDEVIDGRVTKSVVPDPHRVAHIRRVFELRLQGLSYRVIARTLREAGLTSNMKNPRPVTASMIELILRNPFYYGVMHYSGGRYPHRYEPIISKETYDEANKVTEGRTKGGTIPKSDTKRLYATQGLLKCGGCGCSYSSYVRKNNIYIQCSKAKGSCDQRNVAEKKIMPQLIEIVGGLNITKSAVDEILGDLKQKHDNDQQYFQAVIENSKAEHSKLKRRLDAAYEDKLDGRITADEYDELAKRYKAEMESLDRKVVQASSDDFERFILDSEYLLKLSEFAPLLFKSSNAPLKNKLLKILLSNLEIKENHLSYKRWQPFDALASCLETQNWLRRPDSNRRPIG